MRDPSLTWDVPVEFRAADDDLALIVRRGQSQQVPLSWLRTSSIIL
jgi:hypothetical protein